MSAFHKDLVLRDGVEPSFIPYQGIVLNRYTNEGLEESK